MKYGESKFIGVVNGKYKTFVDEDWELAMLLQHFSNEMENGKYKVDIVQFYNVDKAVGKVLCCNLTC
jgi:hypothetical protein